MHVRNLPYVATFETTQNLAPSSYLSLHFYYNQRSLIMLAQGNKMLTRERYNSRAGSVPSPTWAKT